VQNTVFIRNAQISTSLATARTAVLNMIRSPDRDPTGFCTSEPDQDLTGFWKKLSRIRYGYPNCIDHCSKMLNRRIFSDISRIG